MHRQLLTLLLSLGLAACGSQEPETSADIWCAWIGTQVRAYSSEGRVSWAGDEFVACACLDEAESEMVRDAQMDEANGVAPPDAYIELRAELRREVLELCQRWATESTGVSENGNNCLEELDSTTLLHWPYFADGRGAISEFGGC